MSKIFDIEKAKAGAPVFTIDDRMKVRILCFDLDDGDYPIVAAVEVSESNIEIIRYTIDGEYNKGCSRPMNLTTIVRHEGYVFVRQNGSERYALHSIYETKEEAEKIESECGEYEELCGKCYIAKIEWEE